MSLFGRLPAKRRRRRKVSIQRDKRKKDDGTRRVLVTPPSPAPSLLLLWLLCVTSGSPASVPSGHCSQWVNDEIKQCVQPVADFAKTLNKQQQTEESSPSSMPSSEFGQALQWPTKMGGQVFRELCRLINDFELCVDGYRQKCRRHITISLIEASYGFLCNEGFDTFMASAECLMDLDQRPNVKQCHDRTLKSIEEANNDEGGTVATKLDKMCSALNYFSNCVRTPIRQSCGIEAWRVIFRVLKDTTRTLMPQCQFEELNEEKEKEEQKGREEENGRRSDWKEEKEVGKGRGDWKEEKEVGEEEEEEAKAMNGKKDEANGRNRGTALNSVKMTTATPADPFREWEEWEEEDAAVLRPSADEHAELQHQIHYGSQLSRNGASPTEAAPVRTESNFNLFVPFLLSVVLFSSAPLYCFFLLSFFVQFR